MENEYRKAIEEIGTSPPSEERPHVDSSTALAEHLMVLYWQGILVNGHTKILTTFFSQSPGDVRGHAISFIGQSLNRTDGQIKGEIIERLKLLWETRVKEAQELNPTDYTHEMSAFGWWFVSGKFDGSWSIHQLNEALRLVGHVDIDHQVVEKLDELASSFPKEVIQALSLMVDGDSEGWRLSMWKEHMGTALVSILGGDDESAKKDAVSFIHRLTARGHLDFGDLL